MTYRTRNAAQDKAQFESLWKFRESITECLTKEGCVFKYDVSVPVTRMYDVVTDMRQRCVNWTHSEITGLYLTAFSQAIRSY